MKYSRRNILLLTFITEGIALFTAILLSEYFGTSLFPLSENIFRDITLGSAGALPPIAFFLFVMSEKAETIAPLRSLRQRVRTDIKAIFSRTGLPDLFLISVMAGFSEEMLFRGVIQAEFGIIIASIVFAMMHPVSAAYVIATFVMGAYIGAFYYFSRSLLVPIQIHFLYDLVALIYLRCCVNEN